MMIVIDYGSQYTQLIARRLREACFYSEVIAWDSEHLDSKLKSEQVKGVILSGGPFSVYEDNAPTLPNTILESNLPILGICYGLQILAHTLGGIVSPSRHREYGPAILTPLSDHQTYGLLLNSTSSRMWMSHGDRVDRLPKDFIPIAQTPDAPYAAIAHTSRPIFGFQFHPEVSHSDQGSEVLANFAKEICQQSPNWTAHEIISQMTQKIRTQVGNRKALVGVSGGVDSSVAAALVHHAIGDNLEAVFVDNGLLREGERTAVEHAFQDVLKARLTVVDATEAFLSDLDGVTDPELKRKRIGNRFIRTFEKAAESLGQPPCLVQGTIYPDVIESSGGSKTARKIKAHHNVGGLPEDLTFELVEPT